MGGSLQKIKMDLNSIFELWTRAPRDANKMDLKETISSIFEIWTGVPRDVKLLGELVLRLRKLLSNSLPIPIREVIESEVVPILLEIVRDYSHTEPEMANDAMRAIVNIVGRTTEQTQYLIDVGVLPVLKQVLLSNPDERICKNILMCLGNVADDSAAHRDLVQSLGITDRLLIFAQSDKPEGVRRETIWLISNLCGGKPKPSIETISLYLSTISSSIARAKASLSARERGPADALRAIDRIAEGSVDYAQLIFDYPNLIDDIIAVFGENAATFALQKALKVVQTLLKGTVVQRQVLLDASLAKALVRPILGRNREPAVTALRMLHSLVMDSLTRERVMLEILDRDCTLVDCCRTHGLLFEYATILSAYANQTNRDDLLKLMETFAIPLTLCLLIMDDGEVFSVARGTVDTVVRKVGLKQCLQCASQKSSDPRYNLIRDPILIETLVIDNKGREPMDWINILLAAGCDVTLSKPKVKARIREINIITMLVSMSMIPRLRPKLWLPKDVWRLFVVAYVV